MTESAATQPDDLANGVYRDTDGDLWLVKDGTAFVLTDTLGYAHDLGDLVLTDLGEGIAADQANAAYLLRMIRAL